MSGDDVLTMPAARRIEVVTVAGRRRWSAETKAQIVAESYETSVGEVAERYSLAMTQVFTWRRDARRATRRLGFAPVMVDDEAAPEVGVIEVRLGGGDADPAGGGSPDGRGRTQRPEEGSVIGPTGGVKVLIATKPVDFRKGMDGLVALVREELYADPFCGVVYVFRAKRADRVKLVWWDGTGLCLLAKRLETVSSAGPGSRRRDAADVGAASGAAGRARLAACPCGSPHPLAGRGGLTAAG